MGGTANIWSDEWEFESQEDWAAGKSTRLPRSERIGASVYEIAPERASGYYHFHHGAEELLVVLRGRPTLRTPEGEQVLEDGDVVHFPVGPEGAHGTRGRSPSWPSRSPSSVARSGTSVRSRSLRPSSQPLASS